MNHHDPTGCHLADCQRCDDFTLLEGPRSAGEPKGENGGASDVRDLPQWSRESEEKTWACWT